MSGTSEEILKRVNETREVVIRIDARQVSLAEQVGEHHRSLYGNGQPGVVSRVQTLEESRKVMNWALGVAWTAAGTLIGAALMCLLDWLRS